MTNPIIPGSNALAPPAPPKSAKIEDAAKQFEALMIGQMLRTARENSEEGDSESGAMYDIADQQFSKMLADKGGMGLANMVIAGLQKGK
jgi:Rod binding domain-containing protein